MTWVIKQETLYMKKNHETQSMGDETLKDDLKGKKKDKKIPKK